MVSSEKQQKIIILSVALAIGAIIGISTRNPLAFICVFLLLAVIALAVRKLVKDKKENYDFDELGNEINCDSGCCEGVPSHLDPSHGVPSHLDPAHGVPSHLTPAHGVPAQLTPSSRMPPENVIIINNNCGGSNSNPMPGPKPVPVSPALDHTKLMAWISSMEKNLTMSCLNCVVSQAVKLWDNDALQKVLNMPSAHQRAIFNAMLATDCNSDCIVKPNQLGFPEVRNWVNRIIKNQLPSNCVDCIATAIVKTWSPKEFQTTLSKQEKDQESILHSVWLANCKGCNAPVVDKDVVNWVNSMMTGASLECASCVIKNIHTLWDEDQFMKVKSMDKKSQLQILKALVALDCNKECVSIPTKLDPSVISSWVASILKADNNNCKSCVVESIMRLWTPASFAKVQQMHPADQEKVLQGILSFNCESKCVRPSKLSPMEVSDWLKNFYKASECTSCIGQYIVSNWDSDYFRKIKSMDSKDQLSTIHKIASSSCPHVCN